MPSLKLSFNKMCVCVCLFSGPYFDAVLYTARFGIWRSNARVIDDYS